MAVILCSRPSGGARPACSFPRGQACGAGSGERSPAEIDPGLLGIDDAAMADDILGAVDFAGLLLMEAAAPS
ncbi:hypothetical protein ACFYZ2_19570 [Streptomyces sviceus]|uniref:hypothetical protein n=1 Tax=Streptomyces sviceus TaxID=285530 RepID=UPI0036AA589D